MKTSTSRLPWWALVTLLVPASIRLGARGEALPPYVSLHRFEDFAVPRESVTNPAIPRIEGRQARLYRSQIKRAARKPPDFAGHLRIARWGCGTCCQQFAVVNLRNGRVVFPGFSVSCGGDLRDPVQREAGLYYRADSALLVVSGVRNEEEAGVWYFRWTGEHLQLVKTDRLTKLRP
jgi:hypothetical protein